MPKLWSAADFDAWGQRPHAMAIAEVLALLGDVYTDEGQALWLTATNALLDDLRPVDMLATTEGARRVADVLAALGEGVVT